MDHFKCYLNPVLDKLYERITVPGDGSCLFHCLQQGIQRIRGLESLTADDVRQIVCNMLPNTIHRLLNTGMASILFNNYHKEYPIEDGIYIIEGVSHRVNSDSDPSINKYVTYMRERKTYGTRLEILAAQIAFDINICIYTMYGELEKTYENLKTRILDPEKYDKECDVILYHCSDQLGSLGNHFELLIPRGGTTKDKTFAALQVEKYEEFQRQHLEGLESQERALHEELDRQTARALAESDQVETDRQLAETLAWRHKYLKYKTKYLTLKKNTNLLYK